MQRATRSSRCWRRAARGADKTICPSEAARVIGGAEWREAMPVVHKVARSLAEAGVVELRQGGERRQAGAVVVVYRIVGIVGEG